MCANPAHNWTPLPLITSLNHFGQRKLVWGNPLHSPTLLSPSDVGAMLGREDPTEEDVLHTDDLPRFHGTLSSEESEALLSYLTVGYIRVPLVAHFFADLQSIFDEGSGAYELHCGNRATFLFNEQLQALFRSVVLEQVRDLGYMYRYSPCESFSPFD